jgi:hypothetical protein
LLARINGHQGFVHQVTPIDAGIEPRKTPLRLQDMQPTEGNHPRLNKTFLQVEPDKLKPLPKSVAHSRRGGLRIADNEQSLWHEHRHPQAKAEQIERQDTDRM